MIGMAAAGTAADHFESLARRNPLRPLITPAQLLQQQRRPYAECTRQCDQGFQTGGYTAGFETAEHPGADARGNRHIRQRQILAFAHSARDRAELTADIARGGRESGARFWAFG